MHEYTFLNTERAERMGGKKAAASASATTTTTTTGTNGTAKIEVKKTATMQDRKNRSIEISRHSRAFDRIFLCDYMFGFVDQFFQNLVHNTSMMQRFQRDGARGLKAVVYSDLAANKKNVIQTFTNGFDNTIQSRHYDLHMAKRTADLFNSLNVKASLNYKTGIVTIALKRIFALAGQEKTGAGYIYAIMQGLKMGVMFHHGNLENIHKRIWGGEPDGKYPPLQVVVFVDRPYSNTTHSYLQGREGYPPNSVFKTYIGDRKDESANSFEMRLMPVKEENTWYWNVDTLDDVHTDKEVLEETGKFNQQAAENDVNIAGIKYDCKNFCYKVHLRDGDLEVQRRLLGRTADEQFVERMAWYNAKLRGQLRELINRDLTKILFCTESLIGSSIADHVSRLIWERYVQPMLDACLQVYQTDFSKQSKVLKPAAASFPNSDIFLLPTSDQVRGDDPLVYAVLASMECQVKKTRKLYPEHVSLKNDKSDQEKLVPISDFLLDFSFSLVKKRVFAHVELMNSVMCNIIDHISRDVMERGDMFVRRIEVQEGVEQNPFSVKCSHNMMLYGDDKQLQVDRAEVKRKQPENGNKEDKKKSARRQRTRKNKGTETVTSATGSALCCSQCMKTFSLQRSLLRIHDDHLHFI